jgi:phosphomannomutase/phosphoglucomutase
MNPRVFREYDIRGVAERDFPDDLVHALGRAIATMIRRFHEQSGTGGRPAMAVGRDCRLTSPRLFDSLTRGIVATGVDVIDIGVVPTPVLYFAPLHWKLSGAVIITGSHNPPEDNGFKILRATTALHGPDIQSLRTMIEQGAFAEAGPDDHGAITGRDIVPSYLDNAAVSLRLGERRFKIVVDAGNGSGGPAALALYRDRLGLDVVPLYCEMDGSFPNHHPDPSVEDNVADLRARVLSEGAELGIALDGDADRIGAMDGKGRVIWGDQLMILFGRAILEDSPGARFVAEVKCSQALFDELEKAGGQPEMWKVGHSLIKARMKETGALLGGEMSGHIFFAHRYLGFDDAIYAGGRLIEILSRSQTTLAELYDSLPVMVNTPEIRVPCPDESKFEVVSRVTAALRARDDVKHVVDVDGVRASFGHGWGLVRASNTQPALVVRCEAADEAGLAAIRAIIEQEIAAARAEVDAS